MKNPLGNKVTSRGILLGLLLPLTAAATIRYVDLNSPGATSPYTDWSTAATNIQDAIDAAVAGDQIFVTNGVYAVGGKVKGGDLTNRVALDKPLRVESVNGPLVTIIHGGYSLGTNNGPQAVRCAWITNGAVLAGFTLQFGATRGLSPSPDQQMSGGGVYGTSSNALVVDCVLATNTAAYQGGGAYQAGLSNCTLIGNLAIGTGTPGGVVGNSGEGGGAYGCALTSCTLLANFANNKGGGANISSLRNCALVGNSTFQFGGGAAASSLVNCTLTGNRAGLASSPSGSGASGFGGGCYLSSITNSIVFQNQCIGSPAPSSSNYYNGTLNYCCTAPMPTGVGNTNVDPQLLGDGFHLSVTSPCRGAGSGSFVSGMDIDGQTWANPPAIGCDEWLPAPVIGRQPSATLMGRPLVLNIGGAITAGQEPFSFYWRKDGVALEDDSHYGATHTTNLLVNGFSLADVGGYQMVASNAFGMATSAVVKVVIHCVDLANSNPIAPYTNWSTAATNIQDAIDATATGEVVLVTNGVYATGGRVMKSDLTNRVALVRPLTVASVNGAAVTHIRGAWDPTTTNGPLAVRCAWLGDGATLNGFTLSDGASRGPTLVGVVEGGGVWAASNTATVANCVISNNAANSSGGGCYRGTLMNCLLIRNVAGSPSNGWGGGADSANLVNCLVRDNVAARDGGGTHSSRLTNCTVVANSAGSRGGGVYFTLPIPMRNCIVYYNSARLASEANWAGFVPLPDFTYSCTLPDPAVSGGGNTTLDPQLVDAMHLSPTSPCRGSGSPVFLSGADLDGSAWSNPPSMGCNEVVESAFVGPLSVAIELPTIPLLVYHPASLTAGVTGRASRLDWAFGDGQAATNASYIGVHAWTNTGDYTVTLTAYNNDNPVGVSATLLVHVDPLAQPTMQFPVISNNAFRFSFDAQTGAMFRIQYATNLVPPVTWQTLQTIFTSPGGPTQISDSAWTNAARFYRVLVQ